MGVSVSDIAVDKCFRTSGNQVRRVLEVNGDDVVYEARGHKLPPKGQLWGPKVTVNAEKFTADVEEEVAWDWDPDFQNRQP